MDVNKEKENMGEEKEIGLRIRGKHGMPVIFLLNYHILYINK